MLAALLLPSLLASGAEPEPTTSLSDGPAGPRGWFCICCATLQTFVAMASVFLWLSFIWAPTFGGIPHLAA